jgi:hypothetical protein
MTNFMDACSLIRRYESKLPTGQLKHDKNFVKSIRPTATDTGNPAIRDRSPVSKPDQTAKSLGEFNALSDKAHIGTGATHFQRDVGTPERIHR